MRIDSLRAVFIDDGDRRLVQHSGDAGSRQVDLAVNENTINHQHDGVAPEVWQFLDQDGKYLARCAS